MGCGWQAFVAYVNVGCYYVVGIPLGCILGFKFNLGVKVTIVINIIVTYFFTTNSSTILTYMGIYIYMSTGHLVRHDRGDHDANFHPPMGHISHRLE